MAAISLKLDVDRRILFQFGLIALVAFGVLGWLCLRWNGLFGFDFGAAAPVVAYVLWALGAVSAVLSFVRPEANRPLYVGLSLLAYPIGLVVSTILMVVLFFVVITPIALLLKAFGKDPLSRKWDPTAETYWVTRDSPRPPESYFKQF